MLKAYAVALALTTTTPVADTQEGAKNSSPLQNEAATETKAMKGGDIQLPKPTGK